MEVFLIVDVLLWILIVALFILSFIGLIFPLIPSSIALWVGFFIYHFGINNGELTWIFWSIMIVITIILVVADVVANSYFVEKFGGSKRGKNIAGVAVIIGSFITPPFGLIYVPFLAVLAVEYHKRKEWKPSVKASIGSLIGFLTGTVAKVYFQLLMIFFFILAIVF